MNVDKAIQLTVYSMTIEVHKKWQGLLCWTRKLSEKKNYAEPEC